MNEETMCDLCRLVVDRCRKAVDDVAQLVDNDQDRYWLTVNAIANLINDAIDLMEKGVGRQNGKKPQRDKLYAFMFAEILKANNIDLDDIKELRR